ncbi:putative voltage-dependent sodium channel [Ixodes scapularis]
MAIKVTAHGLAFFKRKFHVLDVCAVLFSVASDVLVLLRYQVGVQIRFLRLFRLVYVARSWDTLFYLLNMLMSLFEPLMLLLAIISLVIVVLAILAGDVFAAGPLSSLSRWNYGDFFHSVLLIVRVFCGEMFEPLLDCFHADQGRAKCVPFYVMVLFLGNYVLLNVFLAFLLSNFNVEKIVERFYATENFLITAGDYIPVHVSTASRTVRRVTLALSRRGRDFIGTIGQLKRRFHCLHAELRMQPERCCDITVACCVLHNLAKTYPCSMPRTVLPEEVPVEPVAAGRDESNEARDAIVSQFFG